MAWFKTSFWPSAPQASACFGVSANAAKAAIAVIQRWLDCEVDINSVTRHARGFRTERAVLSAIEKVNHKADD